MEETAHILHVGKIPQCNKYSVPSKSTSNQNLLSSKVKIQKCQNDFCFLNVGLYKLF